MVSGEDASNFKELPPEMLVEVLGFLNLASKKASRFVCKRWRLYLDHSDLLVFKLNLWNNHDQSLNYLLKSDLRMAELSFHNIRKVWPIMTQPQHKFPSTRKIILKSWNSEHTVINVLKYGCLNVETLQLTDRCFSSIRVNVLSNLSDSMKWNLLTDLTVEIGPPTHNMIEARNRWNRCTYMARDRHEEAVEVFLKEATMQSLTRFQFHVLFDVVAAPFRRLLNQLSNFLERHSSTLKGLGLQMCFLSNVEDSVPALIFSNEQQEEISRRIDLDSLEVRVSHLYALRQLVPPFVWKLNKLQTLLCGPVGEYEDRTKSLLMSLPAGDNPIQSLIQNNRNTIINLRNHF